MERRKWPLGERMKALRKERGWVQPDLAQRVGTDARQISRYEKGRILPSLEALAKIAETFDVSADYLLFEASPRRPLRVADPGLAERLGDLGDLAEEDRQLVSRLVDALRVKSKVRSLARECEEATD